jgi:hypothetical protein
MSIDDLDDRARAEYARGKAKFYANPRFAGLVGLAVGIGGTLLVQWIL